MCLVHLPGGVQPLHDDEVDHQPGHDQGAQQLPLHPPEVTDPSGDTQNLAAENIKHQLSMLASCTDNCQSFDEGRTEWKDSLFNNDPLTPSTPQLEFLLHS